MISLLAPLGLAALAALAIPIALHLIRRSDERVLDFAALRWLDRHRLPRRQLRLHDRWLLLLRLLLLSLFAGLLAIPIWRNSGSTAKPWVVVSADVDVDVARAAVGLPQADWRQLAPGFPPLSKDPSSDAAAAANASTATNPAAPPVASLIRQLDADLPAATPLTIVVPSELGGLDSQRLRLSRKLDWRIVPARSTAASASAAASAAAPVDAAAAPIRLVIRYDDTTTDHDADELQVVHALLKAWRSTGMNLSVDEAPQTSALPAQIDWLFWLNGTVSAAARQWIAKGGIALLSHQPAPMGEVALTGAADAPVLIAAPAGRGQMLVMSTELSVEKQTELLAVDFPDRLQHLLLTAGDVPARALALTVTPELQASPANGSASHASDRRLDSLFALAIAALFLCERLWATRRRERVA